MCPVKGITSYLLAVGKWAHGTGFKTPEVYSMGILPNDNHTEILNHMGIGNRSFRVHGRVNAEPVVSEDVLAGTEIPGGGRRGCAMLVEEGAQQWGPEKAFCLQQLHIQRHFATMTRQLVDIVSVRPRPYCTIYLYFFFSSHTPFFSHTINISNDQTLVLDIIGRRRKRKLYLQRYDYPDH